MLEGRRGCVPPNEPTGPNYSAEFVKDCGEKLKKADLPQKIMVSVAGLSFPGLFRSVRLTDVPDRLQPWK